MSLFKFTSREWILKYLPPVQRKRVPLVDLIEAYIEPMKNLFDEFDLETDLNLIRAKASGQPIKMRKALELLTGINGITVTVNRSVDQSFLFLESESEPAFIFLESESDPFYLRLEGEGATDFSFEIGVPAASFTP